MFSEEHKNYLKKVKRQNKIVIFFKIFIILAFMALWEICAKLEIINPFLTSYPSQIILTIFDLFKENNLLLHIWITLYETIISFTLASIIGIIIASKLWSSKTINRILDPYLTVLNT